MLDNNNISQEYIEAQILFPYAEKILQKFNYPIDNYTMNLGISSLSVDLIKHRVEYFYNNHNIKIFLLSNTDVYLGDDWHNASDFTDLYNYFKTLDAFFIVQTLGFTEKKIKENVYQIPILYPFEVEHSEIEYKKRNYGFCFLNHYPKYFRLELGYVLWKNNLLDDIIYSQAKTDYRILNTGDFFKNKKYKEFIKSLPPRHPVDLDVYIAKDHTINHPAYKNAYANIFTESEIQNEVCTEKTFKPFVAGQIPIPLACKGYLKYLRTLGFHTFDDLLGIDYDYLDYSYKISRIVEIVKKGKNYIEDYYNNNIEHIENNNKNIKKFIL